MNFEILPNGNLLISRDVSDIDALRAINERADSHEWFFAELLYYAGWEPNGYLYVVQAEEIAALTSAPILTDCVEHHDDGSRSVTGRIWWFPDYQIMDPARVLIERGRIEMIAAN